MTAHGCPSDTDLAAFNLGELAESVVDAVAAHVEACSRCEERLQALDRVSDGVITSLRGLSDGPAVATQPRTLPAAVGEYDLLEELGRGGLGVVFRARHRRLGREAAVKMLLGGQFADADYRQRFEAEARAVAALRHPNIVPLFEVGEHQGQPYFAMELVTGGSLSARLAGQPQPPVQAARWLAALARAVHYAHEHKIVHRDLKPSNVLLTEDGQPKVCDFGVAKHLEGSNLNTRSGQLVGTPEYMAPEQAAGRAQNVGPAADVYSLGALLYALLTGRPPFQGATVLDTLEQVRSREPLAPSRLQPGVPRDLATVCLKCLEKEPHRRYATAQDLAEDLERFLAGQTIRARPAGAVERGWKWAKRRPAVAALAGAVVGVAVLGFALVLWQLRQTEKARQKAVEQQAELAFNQGLALCDQGEVGRGLLWLVRSLKLADEAKVGHLDRAIRINLADWGGQLSPRRAEVRAPDAVIGVAFDPAGRVLAASGKDRRIHFWDAAGRPLGPSLELPPRFLRTPWVTRVAFHPHDGGLLASGDTEGEVVFWDEPTRRPAGEPLRHPPRHVVWGLAFHPDGTRLVTVCDHGMVRWWEVAARQPVGAPLPHGSKVGYHTLALSRDGRWLVTGGVDGRVVRWDAEAGRPLDPPLPHESPVRALVFLDDDRRFVSARFVSATEDGRVRVWDMEKGLTAELPRHGEGVRGLAVSPDGRALATATASGVVRLWDAATLRPLGQTLKLTGLVNGLAFHPDSRLLVTGQEDQRVGLWEVPRPRALGPPLVLDGPVHHVAFNPNGDRLLTGGARGAQWWDFDRRTRAGLRMHGERYGKAGTVPSLDLQRTYAMLSNHAATAVAPDGTTVAVTRWAAAEGAPATQVELWDSTTGERLRQSPLLPFAPRGVAYGPGEQLLTWGAIKGTARLWDAATLREPRPVLQALDVAVGHAVFTPDGRTLLLGCQDGKSRLWDVDRDVEVPAKARPTHAFPITVVAFDPRSAPADPCVATGCHAGTVRLWDVGRGTLRHDVRGNAGEMAALAFSADGEVLLTASKDGTARFWDTLSGRQLGPALRHTDAVLTAAFHPDGGSVATGTKDGLVQRWRVPAEPLGGDVGLLRLRVEVQTGQELNEDGAVFALTAEALARRRGQLGNE